MGVQTVKYLLNMEDMSTVHLFVVSKDDSVDGVEYLLKLGQMYT